MGDLIIALAIVVGSLVYLCTLPVAFIRLYRMRVALCKDCGRDFYDCFDRDTHWMLPLLAALIWPVSFPMIYIARRADPERTKRENEALQRRIAQLEKEAGLHG